MNHRFINADCYTDTGTGFLGFNMFAYCNNSPVLYSDYSGYALNSNVTVAIFDSGYDEGLWIHESIKLVETEDTITIYAYLTISGAVPSYVVSSGIEYYWEGAYYIDGKMKTLDIIIIEGNSKYGHSIPFKTSHNDHASNTVGPVDMSGVPTVYIYTRRDGAYYSPQATSAHEFGHCLGLEDYYTHDGEVGFDPYHPGIMNILGKHASDEEISMVCQAFYTGQYQYWKEFAK